MYLAFLLIVFYMLCILIFIYIIGQYFFIWCFMKYVYLCDTCRTCTCRTCSEPMHHLFVNDASQMNLWDAWFLNCPAYFIQLENDNRCVLSIVYLCVSFVHNFGIITLLFSDTRYQACDQRTVRLCCRNHEWKIHKADTR
jgi:hypothetical protein